MLFGAHMSIAGGITRAIERAVEFRCDVLQLFVKNASQWNGRALTPEAAGEFREARIEADLQKVIAHDSYLINLASPDDSLRQRSLAAFIDEIERSDRLGLDFLVTHPGAHCGSGEAEGIRRAAESLNAALEGTPDSTVRVCLETTAGQGTSLGARFEEIRDILDLIHQRERVAVCLDTCHVFAAGYDLRAAEGYEDVFQQFDRTIGLEQLAVMHLNDSKKGLGSRVDRHEHIGEGQIGPDAFARLVNDQRFTRLPKILETPKGDDGEWDHKNLAKLRSMVRDA